MGKRGRPKKIEGQKYMDGKKKGGKFETEVYKYLRNNVDYRECKKTLMSGGSDESSDITLILKDGITFVIECKRYKRVGHTLIEKWWKILLEECEGTQSKPILVFKENAEPAVVVEFFLHDIRHALYFEHWVSLLPKKDNLSS